MHSCLRPVLDGVVLTGVALTQRAVLNFVGPSIRAQHSCLRQSVLTFVQQSQSIVVDTRTAGRRARQRAASHPQVTRACNTARRVSKHSYSVASTYFPAI